ncbi:hypothetical protein EDB92DRAFT_1628118 [Lactarius akahatsu]|uniref:Uncharacterized protein n=1 Tax=Lactarius akahatsu TaxID=416441 RepID=A0AAD4L6W5_9AGAM|nr:hypothetical protein EDB92DRAFT_1628118 [Lactarius akahatsu]
MSSWPFTVRLLDAVPASKGDLCWPGCSNYSRQTAVSSSYDALVDLFECVGNFLKRLRIYTDVPLTPSMTDIVVKIMVELLSVFALATKQIRQGRFSKWVIVLNAR